MLSKPLAAAATQEFHVEGTWADPKIAKVPRSLQLLPGLPGAPTTGEGKKTETTQ